ncbi:hypothetical protein [Georgenia sp. SUBG003]|uniref:hypothetical protein n=1 Tax=Georgenia sp. SUBG003 TaxID=1497974 RepID=UPI003AB25412
MGLQDTERTPGTVRRGTPSNIVWGVLLLLAGVLLMLDYLDVLPDAWALWTVVFGVAGPASCTSSSRSRSTGGRPSRRAGSSACPPSWPGSRSPEPRTTEVERCCSASGAWGSGRCTCARTSCGGRSSRVVRW